MIAPMDSVPRKGHVVVPKRSVRFFMRVHAGAPVPA
jgi:hypothetical protein